MTAKLIERPQQVDSLLTTQEAAELLGISPATLNGWRCRGVGPAFTKLGASVRYTARDLERFISSNRFSSTSEADARRAGAA